MGRRNREGSTKETEARRDHGVLEAREESSIRRMESLLYQLLLRGPSETKAKMCLLNVAT